MSKLIDIAGQRFGRLVVQSRHGSYSKTREVTWLCQCTCGVQVVVIGGSLRRGATQSCGCYNLQVRLKHGYAVKATQEKKGVEFRTYKCWAHMLERCRNQNHKQWLDYGGRSITVCDRWTKFEAFLADMGEAPKGLSIERINNQGGYEPGNCCWATRAEQNQNKRLRGSGVYAQRARLSKDCLGT